MLEKVRGESDQRPRLEFLHANGFPAPCYAQLFANLANFRVTYVESLGQEHQQWPESWEALAQEIHPRLDESTPCVGVGHSLGSVVLLYAAQQNPTAFTNLVLLDPPLFGLAKRSALWSLKRVGKMDRVTPAKGALRRRTSFPSPEEARDHFRKRSFFRRFPDTVLRDYVDHALRPDGKEWSLRIPRELEYHLFQTIPLHFPRVWRSLRGTLVYATNKGVLHATDRSWLKRSLPGFHQVPFAGGHMFPLEQSEETAALLQDLLSSGAGIHGKDT